MSELKRRTVCSIENETEYLYEVCMAKMPKAPAQYFREVIQKGEEGWVWTGSGTVVRDHEGVHEVCQTM